VIFQGYINIDRNPCAATNKQGQRTETLHLYQERPKPVFSDWSTNVSFSRKYLFFSSESLFLFSSSVYSKRCFPDQERLLGVLTGQENIFLPSASLFSFRPQSIQRDVFLTKKGS